MTRLVGTVIGMLLLLLPTAARAQEAKVGSQPLTVLLLLAALSLLPFVLVMIKNTRT